MEKRDAEGRPSEWMPIEDHGEFAVIEIVFKERSEPLFE
jgi:hypothetical protein